MDWTDDHSYTVNTLHAGRHATQMAAIAQRTDRLHGTHGPQNAQALKTIARSRKMMCWAAEDLVTRRLLGYVVAGLMTSRIQLIMLRVDPRDRQQGIGSALLQRVIHKLQAQLTRAQTTAPQRDSIRAWVASRNLSGHHWLAGRGFHATGQVRREGDIECYQFAWELQRDGHKPK